MRRFASPLALVFYSAVAAAAAGCGSSGSPGSGGSAGTGAGTAGRGGAGGATGGGGSGGMGGSVGGGVGGGGGATGGGVGGGGGTTAGSGGGMGGVGGGGGTTAGSGGGVSGAGGGGGTTAGSGGGVSGAGGGGGTTAGSGGGVSGAGGGGGTTGGRGGGGGTTGGSGGTIGGSGGGGAAAVDGGSPDAQQPMRTLTVTRAGDGTGTMSVNPGGNNCTGTTCTYMFAQGTAVSLGASPTAGSVFAGWSGGGCSGTAVCNFTITADTAVTGTFATTRALTITFMGAASGSVLVSPGSTTLSVSGTVAIATHAVVTLAATPTANMGFAGWGGACSGFYSCSFTMDADTTVTVRFDPPNRAFVTSTTMAPGSLGGLAGADAVCATRATAGGLSGTFKALLGSSTASAWTRLSGARGWARLSDGKPFGDQVSDLMAGRTYYPLLSYENGHEINAAGATLVVTGVDGGSATATCSDWTVLGPTSGPLNVAAGDPHLGWTSWASAGGTRCSTTEAHLYCFEVARSVLLRPPVPASARYAFLSTANVPGNATIAAADAECQSEASAAGRSGTYRALLAGDGTTAASRFSSSGPPWFRTDDVQLTPTAADFLADMMLHWAPLTLDADGLTHEQANAWAGAFDVATAGTTNGTCNGWTSTTSTTGVWTNSNRMQYWFGPYATGACTQSQRVFCLQQ